MLDDEFHRAKLNGVVSAADGGIVHPVQQIQKKFVRHCIMIFYLLL